MYQAMTQENFKPELNYWQKALKVAISFSGFLLTCLGVAVVLYVVRLPFYNDNIWDFLRPAFYVGGGVTCLTILYALIFYLFENSIIFLAIVVALLIASWVSNCSEPSRCVETRYTSC